MTQTPPAIPRAMRGILSLEDLEPAAERLLPNCLFQFVSGGVETNASRHENRAAFQDYDFLPAGADRCVQATTARPACSAKLLQCAVRHRTDGRLRVCPASALTSRSQRPRRAENIPFILSGASLIRMEELRQPIRIPGFRLADWNASDTARLIDRVRGREMPRSFSRRTCRSGQSRKSGARGLLLSAASDVEACRGCA